jgi:hypothetical protein
MRKHSPFSRLGVFIPVVLILLLGCASSGGDRASSGSSGKSRGSGPASHVASMISGTYRLQEPDSDLRLTISSTGGTGQMLDLFASARGSVGGRNVSEQGVLHLESEGPDARVIYTPHFDPTITLVSPTLNEFSPAETAAACSLVLRPDAGGWEGDTEERGTCVRAIGGAVGRWRMEIREGEIRLHDREGQPLVFRRA